MYLRTSRTPASAAAALAVGVVMALVCGVLLVLNAANASPTPALARAPRMPMTGCDFYRWRARMPYCLAYIGALEARAYPVGSDVVLPRVMVVVVSERTITVIGAASCQPTMWCAETPESMKISFPTGGAMPGGGDIVDVYGRVTRGGLAPVGFGVSGYCDPTLVC